MTKKQKTFRRRRIIVTSILIIASSFITYKNEQLWRPQQQLQQTEEAAIIDSLNKLEVKGRAPKTNYSRDQFGNGWATHQDGCDTRNKILKRDLTQTTENEKCQILTGILNDPYTGLIINFSRKNNSSVIQIDHVVALSDAWQKGAQQLDSETRNSLANDPLNLLAVDGPTNQQKGDSDAATWLPPNKPFRCQYVERQITVKAKYNLWVTAAEKAAIENILTNC